MTYVNLDLRQKSQRREEAKPDWQREVGHNGQTLDRWHVLNFSHVGVLTGSALESMFPVHMAAMVWSELSLSPRFRSPKIVCEAHHLKDGRLGQPNFSLLILKK